MKVEMCPHCCTRMDYRGVSPLFATDKTYYCGNCEKWYIGYGLPLDLNIGVHDLAGKRKSIETEVNGRSVRVTREGLIE